MCWDNNMNDNLNLDLLKQDVEKEIKEKKL